MKETQIDFELPKDSKPRWPKYLTVGAIAVATVGLIMYAGAMVYASTYPPKLPGNTQCIASNQAVKEAAKTFSVQLVAAIDGVDAPAPDLSKVKTTSKECVETAGEVTVASPVGEQK